MKVKTYLINLDGSDERLFKATEQLNAVGWAFERFSAFDGRGKSYDFFPDYKDEQSKKMSGRSLLNSEIGCYLSHYGCVEKFLGTDADYLVVLEDDLQISSDFSENLNQTLTYLDTHPDLDWHLVNIAAKKKKLAKDIVDFKKFKLWHAYYFPIRGLGLIWSREGAEAFLQAGRSIEMPVDVFFQSWLSKSGKGLGVWPAFVRPAGLDSDILGTVASQGISRKQKENRNGSYEFKKQRRMWRDRYYAIKHLFLQS